MFTKDLVIERLGYMRNYYGMFAMTKEAYVATVSILLECVGVPGEMVRDFNLSLGPPGPSCEYLLEWLDEAFANEVCDKALKVLEQLQ